MSKNNKKIYTADFVLLFVSFSIPFGWTMSGFSPSIELACACWAVTLGVLLHCFLIWTKGWNKFKWTRPMVVLIVVIAAFVFSWNPIIKQYRLQHAPPESQKPQQSPRWYLAIKGVNLHKQGLNQTAALFYRITIDVNGQKYSYPFGYMFCMDESNVRENFPIYGDGPYHISFEGKLIAQQDDMQYALASNKSIRIVQGSAEEIFTSGQLPKTNLVNSLESGNAPFASTSVTSLEILYDIIKD